MYTFVFTKIRSRILRTETPFRCDERSEKMTRRGKLCLFVAMSLVAAVAVVWAVRTGGADDANVRWEERRSTGLGGLKATR